MIKKTKSFPLGNPAPYDAYWVKPIIRRDGARTVSTDQYIGVDDRHIIRIVTHPQDYGLTKSYIVKVHSRYHEPIGSEGNAREEIMASLINQGWIRARYVRSAASWTVQVRGRQDFGRIRKLAAYLLKSGASQFDQVVILDLGGFRLDGGEDTLAEVEAGALERKRKAGQFAAFLNPGADELRELRLARSKLIGKALKQIASSPRQKATNKLIEEIEKKIQADYPGESFWFPIPARRMKRGKS